MRWWIIPLAVLSVTGASLAYAGDGSNHRSPRTRIETLHDPSGRWVGTAKTLPGNAYTQFYDERRNFLGYSRNLDRSIGRDGNKRDGEQRDHDRKGR